MQTRICSLNRFATFVPCFGHSLNLVGVEAAKACTETVAFFDLLQAVYVFFAASTGRSCRADACRAFVNGYEEIITLHAAYTGKCPSLKREFWGNSETSFCGASTAVVKRYKQYSLT